VMIKHLETTLLIFSPVSIEKQSEMITFLHLDDSLSPMKLIIYLQEEVVKRIMEDRHGNEQDRTILDDLIIIIRENILLNYYGVMLIPICLLKDPDMVFLLEPC